LTPLDTTPAGAKIQEAGREDAPMKQLTAVLLCAVFMVCACRETTKPPDLIVGTGTIVPRQAECSSWFVRSDTGQLYELTALGSEFQQKYLRVRFTLRERPDLASVCMVGPIADVVSIEPL
jgi:hypothetical protein